MTNLFTQDELRSIASGASTLQDRCSGKYEHCANSESIAKAERRLSRWCEIAAGGDQQVFCDLLGFMQINNDDVLTLLGDVKLASTEKLPDWIEVFSWVAESMTDEGPLRKNHIPSGKQEPIPFEELFETVADQAYKRLNQKHLTLLSSNASENLRNGLIKRISDICAPSLFDDFCLYRTFEREQLGSISSTFNQYTISRAIYDGFVKNLRETRVTQFFQLRPVLARLVSVVVSQWIGFTNNFIHRLYNDLAILEKTFNSGKPLGKVKYFQSGLSDPHNGGNSVCKLEFTQGTIVAYKPKDLQIDKVWGDLLIWLESKSAPLTTISPTVVVCDEYGWVQWVSGAEKESAKSKIFYEGSGSLLCLLHMLQTTDIHFENVIASNSCLIPVDLETLFHPRPTIGLDSTSVESATLLIQSSVASTGFLPFTLMLKNGDFVDIGGLSFGSASRMNSSWLSNINTDQMSTVSPEATHEQSEPNGIESELHSCVRKGYEAMYDFIIQHKTDLLASGGPLNEFFGKRVRVVRRSTMEYDHKIKQSMQRTCLSSGIDRSIKLFSTPLSDVLCTNPLKSFAVDQEERFMLENLDVPYFWTQTDSDSLSAINGFQVAGYLQATSFNQVRAQLGVACLKAMRNQLDIIDVMIDSSRETWDSKGGECWGAEVDLENLDEIVIETAESFGNLIINSGITGRNGTTWIGVVPLPGGTRGRFEICGADLYGGTTGLAFFLSALYSITKIDKYKQAALSCVASIRSDFKRIAKRSQLTAEMGIGAGFGLASIIYGFVKCAEYLQEPDLFSDAADIASLITIEIVQKDKSLDVLTGTAGALLGLVSLYEKTGDQTFLEQAKFCGARLIETQGVNAELDQWVTLDSKVLPGLAHGISGIAMSLVRLYSVSDNTDYLDAAKRGFTFVHSTYSHKHGTWPDVFNDTSKTRGSLYLSQWCHGAAGIGLARLDCFKYINCDEAVKDIDNSISNVIASSASSLDQLCCGNFGRLELLISAGDVSKDSNLLSVAKARSAQLATRGNSAGQFGWASGTNRQNPTLFFGMAGVGYQLLRLIHPEKLTSLATWR